MPGIFKLTLIFVSLLFSVKVLSQVTVGLSEAPARTALLQLKSQSADASNITSTKGGLLLPRVKLVNLSTLQPFMDPTDPDYNQEKNECRLISL